MDEDRPASSSSPTSPRMWRYEGSFLELYFTDRELALMSVKVWSVAAKNAHQTTCFCIQELHIIAQDRPACGAMRAAFSSCTSPNGSSPLGASRWAARIPLGCIHPGVVSLGLRSANYSP
jgi:hypothetical protein